MEIIKPTNYTLKLYGNPFFKGSPVYRFETKSKRRFITKLKLLPPTFYGYLRVHYSDGGSNEGKYKNRKDFMQAFKAFTE